MPPERLNDTGAIGEGLLSPSPLGLSLEVGEDLLFPCVAFICRRQRVVGASEFPFDFP